MNNYIPSFSINGKMLNLASEITELLGKISGLNDLNRLPRLRRQNRIKSIHSSLAIENNTLSLKQVSDIIDGKRVLGQQNEIQEVKNAFDAYSQLGHFDPYSIKSLQAIHRIMMYGLADEVGMFRISGVGVFSGEKVVHVAPPAENVFGLVDNLLNWVRVNEEHPLIKTSVFHYEFEYIHPFQDGNGRMGRLWQTALLSEWRPIFEWLPIETIIKDRQQDYYRAISQSNSVGNSNDFIVFMLETLLDCVENIETDASYQINFASDKVKTLISNMKDYPMSAKDLMELVGLKSLVSFKANYIKPALEAGLIEMTIPDIPTSKNQKYLKK